MTDQNEHLTLPQAARAQGCSWSAAYRLILNGTLPAEQMAGRWLVDADELKKLVAERAGTLDPKSGGVSRVTSWTPC